MSGHQEFEGAGKEWFSHRVQCWKEKPGKEFLDRMEVPWSKNKGRKSGVMRALERLPVVTWKVI